MDEGGKVVDIYQGLAICYPIVAFFLGLALVIHTWMRAKVDMQARELKHKEMIMEHEREIMLLTGEDDDDEDDDDDDD